MRLDKRIDWGAMEERATRHFAKRDAINAAPRERMAAHPRADYCKQLDSIQAAADWQIKRAAENELGPVRAAAMRSRREAKDTVVKYFTAKPLTR